MDNLIEKSFEGLTSAFGTPFEMEEKDVVTLVKETEKQVQLIEDKKNELVTGKIELVLKDQSFLEEELRTLIVSSGMMLAKLESEIKIGSKSSYYDSYAKLATARTGILKELRELNISVIQTELEKRRTGNDINTGKRATIVMDANTLLEFVNNARLNSQVNKIDASFTIDGDE
jgi:hypothetical protein